MSKQPLDFKRISHKQYVDFALELGLSSLGMYLVVKGKIVGWRTKRYVYVDPDVYNEVMGSPSYPEDNYIPFHARQMR